ncbi:hypothetical protein ASPBRDRAFT_36309 [Aspergillus brasiliensis CBS 101740]|uniref:GST C-terminal domain-containing protein n=1 Tax=Aspergillus brasiliensis (strain CBS 101740 / IMI 381727 / IBT 21946) TaxID=767769 RepID=A0A1L9UZJ5_ASPBC|nr:hypothetical protein ASPBRDRAFT_36309 [Aspergillus brasiliensis CBS 101740]
MNVFDEEPSTITLSTPKASTIGTTIAIILEELRLPYTLHLLPHNHHHHASPTTTTTTTTLTDIHRTGHGTTLHSLPSITTYLLTRYDSDNHHLSYPPRSPEHAAVEESLSKLADRMGIAHDHGHEHEDKHHPYSHKQQQQLPIIKETEVEDTTGSSSSASATAKETIPFARRLLSLYLHLEEYLSRQRRGGSERWLVGEKCAVADIAHFPYVAAAGQYGFDLEKFPEVTGWYDRLMRRRGVRRGWERVVEGE